MTDISVETRTVERKYVTIGDESFPAGYVLDLIEALQGTDGFVSGVNCGGLDADIAEALEETEAVGHSYSAGYFEKDAEALAEMQETIWEAYDADN